MTGGSVPVGDAIPDRRKFRDDSYSAKIPPMPLLQISEPGAPPPDRPRQRAAGIDLGTTNSLVATVDDNGKPRVIPDADGRAILPSLVKYRANNAPLVGDDARAKADDDPRETLASVKRLMGRGAKDAREHYRYQYADRGGMAALQTAAGEKSPVEVSAEILRVLAVRAEKELGGPLHGAVVTVPAYFDDAQRQATKAAAELAGLRILRLLNEPTAAAVAYGLDEGDEGAILVYDLGGGTFDVSILRLRRGVFETLAVGGDSALGGDDYDRALANLAAKKTQAENPGDADFLRLVAAARTAKESLSENESAKLRAQLSSGAFECEVDADEFAAATESLTARTVEIVSAALRDAKLKPDDIAATVMVGGATRMPQTRKAMANLFGRAPRTELNPDEVVALGAAAQADVLAGNKRGGEWLLLDVIPLSLGLETMGGLAEKVIPRNSPLPLSRAQEFTTQRDGQSAMAIHVVQGERELIADCRSLARFNLTGIPPRPAGTARVRVEFRVDADGLLSVEAREKETGTAARVEVRPSFGLTEDEIAGMLKASFSRAQEDADARRLAEAKVDAEQLIRATDSALKEDGELLSDSERTAAEAALENLRAEIEKGPGGTDAEKIRAMVKKLNAATEDFAARRMNRQIRAALEGRRVDEV